MVDFHIIHCIHFIHIHANEYLYTHNVCMYICTINSFMRNDYEKAIELYTKAITELKENENMQNDLESKQTVGDIHVKLSSILQGQGELSYSLRYLTKARDIYKECANMMIQNQHQKSQSLDDSQCYNCASSGRTLRSAKGGESILEHSSNKNNNNEHKIDNVGVAKSATESKSMLTDQVLALKIVEIITGIANIYVDKGDIDNATEHYQVSSMCFFVVFIFLL